MKKLELLTHYIQQVTSDERLKTVHLSLLIALCERWIYSDFSMRYQVSRKALMKISHIRSKATYHKTLRELQHFGYLKYIPSFHPRLASTIEITNLST